MKPNPRIINKITVSYFRSINKITLKNVQPVNVITGGNDVGKSNLLRSLNLFFNEKDEYGKDFDFQREFSKNRLATVQKESVKGQQFIRIDVEFNCSDAFPTTLPDKFVVTKKWTRDSDKPVTSHFLQREIDQGKLDTTIAKAEGSLSRFLKQIEFHYVPAIKDDDLFSRLLGELQIVLSEQAQKKGSSLVKDMEKFNSELQVQASELRKDFFSATGVQTNIGLPIDNKDLFQAFEVRTDSNAGAKVGLNQRGDGIRVRFIPEILNYIAERSNKAHIWGFEEPENSMEYRKAFELADKMAGVYSKNSQIFITTHSPAFFQFQEGTKSIYLARQVNGDTSFRLLDKKEEDAISEGNYDLMLADELGHVALMHDLHDKLTTRIEHFEEKEKELNVTSDRLSDFVTPVLLTEGKTDRVILTEAWNRVRPGTSCPFKIEECDTISSGNFTSGGAEKLATCLKAVRPNNPNVVIGLFDYDFEGLKRYRLDNTFEETDLFDKCKVSFNKKSVAMCIQGCPDYHEKFREFENLTIEFLFPFEVLSKEVDGRSLTLRPKTLTTSVNGKTVSQAMAQDNWLMEASNNKAHFAEKIVPTLEDSDFKYFDLLFSRVEKVLTSLTL